ncbi:hypothetical protein EON83_23905 [bacterium]|nr:MAG: hypothetical protein EON83_23905 [bacterium]
MNTLQLIEELETLVEKSSGLFGKRLVNEEQFFGKIQQLRASLPQTPEAAEQLKHEVVESRNKQPK